MGYSVRNSAPCAGNKLQTHEVLIRKLIPHLDSSLMNSNLALLRELKSKNTINEMQPFFIFQMVIQSNPTKQENKLEQKCLIISSLINIAPLFA